MSMRSVSYALQRLIMRPFLIAKSKQFGLKFRFKAEDVVGRFIYKYDVYEPETTHCLLSKIQFNNNDIVLDVGANIGWYSLVLASKGAQIHAFEPDPLNYRLLNENIALNGYMDSVHTHQLALSDQEATMSLYLYPDKNRGRHSLNRMEGCEKIDVKTTRLDKFIAEKHLPVENIRLLKMDIEGHEYPALKGAEELLQYVPYLLIEHAPDHIRRGGYNPEDLINLLDSYDYIPYRIGENGCEQIGDTTLIKDETEQNIFWKKCSQSTPS